jgi:two-component system, chemotaxis family, CheB/CheR fusion protein
MAESSLASIPSVVEKSAVNPAPLALVVDDDRGVCSLVGRILRRQGLRVLEASSGEQALRVAAGIPDGLDLLVTDIAMYEVDGFQLANTLRGRWPELPVLVVSGTAFSTAPLREGTGPALSVEKPFEMDDIIRSVQQLLPEFRMLPVVRRVRS